MTPSFSPRQWIKRCVEVLKRSRSAPPRQRRRKSLPLTLEYLEERCVPTSVAPGNYSGTITTNTEFDQAGTYTINGPLAVASGATLTVGKAGTSVNLVIDSGDTLTVRGALNVLSGVPVSIAANYGVTTEILVANGGTMSSTGAAYSGSGSGVSVIEIAGNGQITASGNTFGQNQLNLDPGSIVGAGSLVGNTFNTTLFLPATDVQYLSDSVNPANDNVSFEDIDVLPGSIGSGQTLALNAIGTATTANLRYVFSDLSPSTFTVQSGATLTVGPNVNVLIQSGVTLTDDGAATFGSGDTVTFTSNYGATTNLLVGSGGTLNAVGTTFTNNVNLSSYFDLIEVGSGGELTASGSTFVLNELSLDSGSIHGAGALVGNTFNNPLYLPASEVQYLSDIANPANDNLSFEDIGILPGSIASGQTLALNAIGSATTANLRYVFTDLSPATFTVASGASLTVAPYVSVLLQSGLTLTDDGAMSFGNGDTVTFTSNYDATTTLLVGSGGTLNASGTNFVNSSTYYNDVIEVGSGGELTANGSTFAVTQFNLDSGSTDTLSTDLVSGLFTINSGATINIANNDFTNIGTNGLIAAGSSSATINLDNNYWGTTISTQIAAKIEDHSQNANLPTVSYSPFLTEHPAQAAAAPASVAFSTGARNVTLSVTVTSPGVVVNEGTVTFTILNGNTVIGTAVTVNVVNGAASANYALPAGLAGGMYTIQAAYNGTSNYAAYTDASQSLTINAAVSATAAAASATFNSSTNTVALSATVTSGAGTVNEGTETFTILNGMTVIGTAVTVNVVNGAADANYALPAGLGGGTYTIQAVYNGTADFLGFTDASHVLTINAAVSATAAAAASATFNSSTDTVSLSATVTSGAGTVSQGTETFTILNGNTVIGTAVTVNVVSGAAGANYTLPAGLAGGTYTIQAIYNGTADFAAFTDASHQLTISPALSATAAAAASTTFTSSTNTVALSATVTSGAGTVSQGTETFTILNGNTVIGTAVTVNVVSGAASANYTLPAGTTGGSYTIQAVYNGTADFLAFTDASHVLTINAAVSATAAANASAAYNVAAQSVALSATVTSGAGTVSQGTETFTILNGNTVIGMAITVNVVNGAASANYTLPAGTAIDPYTIQAVYNGTADFLAFTDASHVLTVSAASATTTAAANASATFNAAAQSVALSATVTSGAGTVNEGTETFTVLNGGTTVGTAVTVNVVNGAASANYALPAGTVAGSYTIQAVYNGDANFLGFTDNTHHLTVSAAASATAAANVSATYNTAAQTATLSATVTSGAGPVSQGTETFTILNGATVIGTAVTVNVVSGVASANYTLPAGLAGGTYTIQAVYNGAADFLGFTDNTHHLTITQSTVVAAEFPGQGVWRYDSATGWQQLTAANASQLAYASTGEVVADLNGQGVWRYTNGSGWQQLSAANASLLALDAGGFLAAEFPGPGVWRYNNATGWQQLTAANASLLAIDAAGEVAADLNGQGVWRYTNASGWQLLSAANASLLAMDAGGDLAAEFSGQGVWRYNNGAGWQQLTAANASQLAIDAAGEVAADLNGQGVWRYTNGSGWQQFTAANASLLALDAGGDMTAEFPGQGVWLDPYGLAWTQLTGADASLLAMDV